MTNQEYPLVSALMIICKPNITNLVKAIDCFQKQSYPYKELIIVNNASTQLEASEINIKAEQNVFLIDTPEKLAAGQAKNYAISASNGQILAQFDVDCWHHPKRLEAQIATMAHNEAAVCMLDKTLMFSFNSGRAGYWENPAKIIPNSMIYIRPALIDYPPVEKGEELGFLNKLTQFGNKSISMSKPDLMCKLHYSKTPINTLKESILTKNHNKIINKILKTYI